MSCGQTCFCHGGGRVAAQSGSPRVRVEEEKKTKAKKNVKHLECGGEHERALRKRDDFTPELLQSGPARPPRARTVPRTEIKRGGPGGVRSPGEKRPKAAFVWRAELQPRGDASSTTTTTSAGCDRHRAERFQIVFKVSVHTLCTDCALNFLTYFIHKTIVHL